MSILLTGGMGYIGSHTAVDLMEHGYDVIIADSLFNSETAVLDRIAKITGKHPAFYCIDVSDKDKLNTVFSENDIECVIHFAGHKIVSESVKKPIVYYRNNLDTTLSLLEMMQNYHCENFVFSSSAAVYGLAGKAPYQEDSLDLGCVNPYGWTKYMNEQILKDVAMADRDMSVVLLRYFNPVGAHISGLIGESPVDIPSNLMPYITQVAAGMREQLYVYGNDYPTYDGTGVRDYIHVMDLARGHVSALEYALRHKGCETVNLGTGRGYSVLDVVKTFETVNKVTIPYKIVGRREGDLAVSFADTQKARDLFHWSAEKSLEDMCRDAWNWQKRNGSNTAVLFQH